MEPGTRVEVRSRFQQTWARGFEVAEVISGPARQFRIRRRSDGSVLPTAFDDDDVREERRKQTWWI